jgi:hypothetical protein
MISIADNSSALPRLCIVALLFLLATGAGSGAAYALTDDEAIEAGRKRLSKRGAYPWYSAEDDDVQRVDVAPPPPPPTAGDWEWKTPNTGRPPSFNFGAMIGRVLLVVGFTVLIGLLALIVWLLMRSFLESETLADAALHRAVIGTDNDVDRVDALPFKVRRPRGDLLDEARRQYEAGNYNEAVIYFYSYLLVELDKGQLIRLTRGKTNRQYLREIRRRPLLFELLEMTMVAFEDVFFGHHSLGRDRFESCFRRLDEFETQVREAVV